MRKNMALVTSEQSHPFRKAKHVTVISKGPGWVLGPRVTFSSMQLSLPKHVSVTFLSVQPGTFQNLLMCDHKST